LVKPHLTRLYRLAFRLTGNSPDAEDLVQDVLVKMYQRGEELASIESLGPWLARVLYHQFVDNTRRYAGKRLRTVSIDDPANEALVRDALHGAPEPRQSELQPFHINALARALAGLSFEHRTVVLLHDSEGYKLEEIQALTGVSLGTVKSRLHRARARLRKLLGGHGTF
jgi:RNA polymerase sigma-70 factor (ECF subfamily)